ncbi:MAG: PKD domain-containing protein, partial [Bacteroidota bacterium]
MLYRYRLYLSCLVLSFITFTSLRAQEQLPLDSLCVVAGEGFITNLLADDFPGGQGFTVLPLERECFRVDREGNLFFGQFAGEDGICCNGQPNFFTVQVFEPGTTGGEPLFLQPVELTIKCPKPDCGIVDLTEVRPLSPTMGDEPTQFPPDCIQACENSSAIYLFPEDPNQEYNWTAVNGVVTTDPGLPGQVSVTWGDVAGGGVLTVTTTDLDGNFLSTFSWCIELTPSPVADFTATSVACLDQPVYFTNTSTGAAATYDWDFGDGNTAQNITNPSHVYETAGTFTVTLYATSDGTNPDGSQACCCTDTVSYDITIDPLPGPQIYWISTLCEGDASKYWTDATGCDYTWSVSANGTMTPTGFPDTIMVTWGSGPSGTVSLQVENCDDVYCDQPTVAVVPIISSNGVISGPTEVCKGESANYELPKWLTVAYDWGVSAGAINGPNNGHVVNVTWPTTPGTYVIEASYGSDFLNGLPNHEGDDCYGKARLEVTVLGDFTLNATPNPACVYQSVTIFGTSDIDAGATYDWSVVGFPGLTGTGSSFNINPGDVPGPGVYTITAAVTNPADYCVVERSINVVIKEAITPVIDGPTDYCVGEPVVYTIVSPAPGYTYNWTVAPGTGMVDAGQGSPTATIIFTATTGVSLSVTGTDGGSPACISDPATVSPVTKDFMGSPEIYGPAPCTNSLADYGITDQQHPDATYTWTVIPATSGSVVEGVNDSVATIQWNNDDGPVTISLEIELCGQTLTLTESLNLSAPIEPVILQDGDLCPSGSAFLYVDDSTNFTSFLWTLPQGAGPTTGGFTITSPGDYVVNTIDVNGCPGVARYRVETVDGPEVTLSVDGVRAICVDNVPYPPNPIITATTGAGNLIEWFCNGISQGAAATGNTTLTHVWNDTIKVYAYTVIVTDANGCTAQPDPVFIRQEACCGPPYESQPLPQNHTFTLVRNSPDCDIVDLVATWPADSVDCHSFDVPLYSQVIDFGGDETAANDSLTIRLPGVGCYQIDSEIFRWAYDYDTTSVADPVTGLPVDSIFVVDSIKCGTEIRLDVCNPLLAEFDYSEDCGEVTFENESLVDLGLVSGSVNYNWDFGDTPVATSTDENPTHTYTTNGTYTVTLVVSDDDCQSTYVLSVVVDDIPDSDFTFAPAP